MKAAAIYHTAPGQAEVREIELNPPKDDEIVIDADCSAISPGTESMIYRGRMPSNMSGDSVISSLGGPLEYPFRYGYSLVGTVSDHGTQVDRSWLGRKVFAFHPHQSKAVVPTRDCLLIPDHLSAHNGLFLPSMESAANFVMDGNPGLGSRVIVFGLGIVGLLTYQLLSRCPLADLIGADPLEYRRRRASQSNGSSVVNPDDEHQWGTLRDRLFSGRDADGVDIAFELSGNLQALNQAIEVTGFSGTVLLGSWYGTQTEPLDLGGPFHRRRIQLLASQVSTIRPDRSGRWTKARRIDLAWHWIDQLQPADLITHRFSPEDCDRAFQVTSRRLEQSLQVIFEYS